MNKRNVSMDPGNVLMFEYVAWAAVVLVVLWLAMWALHR